MEARIAQQMADLRDRSGVEHENFIAARDKRVAQMGPEKTGAAGD
jgi:hypothetical protein